MATMDALSAVAAKASAAYSMLTEAAAPILRHGSLREASCFPGALAALGPGGRSVCRLVE